eukprot:6461081-Pyramimonas_sp.AAC.1
MGGGLPKPATPADLGEDARRACSSAPSCRELSWHIPPLSGEQTMPGLQHRGGALIFAEVFCRERPFAGVHKLRPAGAGASLEGH